MNIERKIMPAIRKPVGTSCLGSVVSGGSPIRMFNVVGSADEGGGLLSARSPDETIKSVRCRP